jgi:hypothetical protein
MATITKFQDFAEQLGRGVHHFATDTFRLALTNTAPDAAGDAGLADVANVISNANFGGVNPAVTVTVAEASGTMTITGGNVVITATGTVPSFRYYVLYNDSATSPADAVIAYWDHGTTIDMISGETFSIKWNSNAGTTGTILTIA